MNPIDFMKKIYLGDRGIKGFIVDSSEKIVKLHIDEISRIRSLNGDWNFYNEENLTDGKIVFDNVLFFFNLTTWCTSE